MGLRDSFLTGKDYFDIMRSMKFERLGLRGLRMHGLASHHVDPGAVNDDSRWHGHSSLEGSTHEGGGASPQTIETLIAGRTDCINAHNDVNSELHDEVIPELASATVSKQPIEGLQLRMSGLQHEEAITNNALSESLRSGSHIVVARVKLSKLIKEARKSAYSP